MASSMATTNKPDRAHGIFGTLESFLNIFGNAEYSHYVKSNAAPHLSYEKWASSEHVLGPYLYHLTLDTYNETTSSVSH